MHGMKAALRALVLLAVGLAPVLLDAQTLPLRQEYKLKAAFIYNFLQFIEWPSGAFSSKDSPLVIGVYDQDELTALLQILVDTELINNRRIVVRRLTDTSDFSSCQLIFVPRTHANAMPDIISQTDGKNVLTVGESKGFARNGGAINFYVEENKLRFEVNRSVLKRSNLQASSRLLRLARIVESGGGS